MGAHAAENQEQATVMMKEIDELNKIMHEYREYLLCQRPILPRDENGGILNLDKKIQTFRDIVKDSTIKVRVLDKLTENINMISLEDLAKKMSKDG